MSELEIFRNEEFGEIRTVEVDGKPYFVASDVANALGYSNPRDAVARHCKGVVKRDTPTSGGAQNMSYIPEGDLYRLITHSKLESAERFEAWVFDEILPSIRKNGGYIAGQETLSDEELLSKALMVAQRKIEEKNQLIAEKDSKIGELETETLEMNKTISEMKPKVNYVDMILQSTSTVLVTQIAQDYGMSAKAFNKKLKELGVQRYVGGQWILYGKYQGNGYVHSKTINIVRTNGQPDVKMQTEWTQKGRLFLYDLLKENGIYPLIEKGISKDEKETA